MGGGAMNRWVVMRLTLLGLNAIPLSSSQSIGMTSISTLELAGVMAFCAPAVPAMGFMIRRAGRLTVEGQSPMVQWSRPSWSKSPFKLSEPTQFFHLAAFIFMSRGASSQLLLATDSLAARSSAGQLFLACGLGLWLGAWLAYLGLGGEQAGNRE